MLKKLAIVVGSLLAVSMVACSDDNVAGGGTIDPSTLAVESSSSGDTKTPPISSPEDVVSSSGMSETKNGLDISGSSSSSRLDTPKEESSSSCEDCGNDISPIRFLSSSSEKDRSNVIVRPRNFSLECSVDVVNVDPDEPAVSSDVLAPYASKSVAADSVNILISDYFNIPCGESEAEAFMERANTPEYTSLGLNYDTLYVKVIRSKGMSYDCLCVARVQFTLDAEYSDIKYTVFEQRNAIQLKELE